MYAVSLCCQSTGGAPAAPAPASGVADHGQGIPCGDVARATQRFFRGEQARHTPGSGLGLALVQAVATLHDGALRLEPADPAARPPGLSAVLTLRSRRGA